MTTYRNLTLTDLVEIVRGRGLEVPAPGHDDSARMEQMIADLNDYDEARNA